MLLQVRTAGAPEVGWAPADGLVGASDFGWEYAVMLFFRGFDEEGFGLGVLISVKELSGSGSSPAIFSSSSQKPPTKAELNGTVMPAVLDLVEALCDKFDIVLLKTETGSGLVNRTPSRGVISYSTVYPSWARIW